MVLLFFLGRLLEPALGTARFVVLYFTSLLAGSFAVLLMDPNALTLGASGAIFGVAGATFVIARGRGMDAIASQLGFLIVINLVFGLGVRNVSIGAHIGGLIGGVICGLLIVAGERGKLGGAGRSAEFAAMALVAVLLFLGAIAVA
jgi:membrane associated rhomboid family serine protease